MLAGASRRSRLLDQRKRQRQRREKEKEKEKEKETETDSSAGADPPPPSVKAGKKNYPEDFEAFWRAYPTDPLMSKLKAAEKWQRLAAEDRAAAMQAVPGFRAHCAKDPTYRPVHAERFLSQRRFDGFNAAEHKQGAAAPGEDAGLRAEWGGQCRTAGGSDRGGEIPGLVFRQRVRGRAARDHQSGKAVRGRVDTKSLYVGSSPAFRRCQN